MQKWLNEWFPSKRFIKLLSVTKACQLTFNQRLVYSFLVYRSRLNKGVSVRGIAKSLQLDRNTVRVVVRKLVELGLVAKKDGNFQAVEPTGPLAEWFVSPIRLAEAKFWGDRLAYIRYYLPMPLKEKAYRHRLALTLKQNAIYCLLLNLSKELPPDSEEAIFGLRLCTASQASVAGLLGLDRQTVRKALVRLEQCSLMEAQKELVVLLRPEASQLAWFQTRKPKKQTKPMPNLVRPWESMTVGEIELAIADPELSDDLRLLRRLRLSGRYSFLEVRIIQEKAIQAFGCMDADRLRHFFKEAEKEHQESQGKGRYMGMNSFNLLKFKLDQAIEQRRLRTSCS